MNILWQKTKQKIISKSSMGIFRQEKPRFNAFQSGTGIHGDLVSTISGGIAGILYEKEQIADSRF